MYHDWYVALPLSWSETPSDLCRLEVLPESAHDPRPRHRALGRPSRLALRAVGHRPRDPSAAPSARRSSPVRWPTPPVTMGSDPLGLVSRLWTGWRSSLVIVRPATVLAWHR